MYRARMSFLKRESRAGFSLCQNLPVAHDLLTRLGLLSAIRVLRVPTSLNGPGPEIRGRLFVLTMMQALKR
jgi:hypothetical protein